MSHVLFIQPELSGVGGIQKVLPKVFRGLSRNGFVVSVLSFYGKELDDKSLNFSFSLHETISSNPFNKLSKSLRRAYRVFKIIKCYKPDVVIVSTHNTASLVGFLKSIGLIKIPVIHYVHQSFYGSGGRYSPLTLYLQRYLDGFIVVSAGLSDEVKRISKISGKPVEVAYNSISINKKRALKPSMPHFVSASRIEIVKGVDVLVELMIRYFKDRPGSLSIYGDGALRQKLVNKVNSLGLSNQIIFCGPTDDISPKLVSTTAYISCARSEAFGLSLIESLAAGVPVVCTDAPYGPREIFHLSLGGGTYPITSEFGQMFAEVPPIDPIELSKWIDLNYSNFEKSLDVVINNSFSQDVLKSRAAFFSEENQINQIEKVINMILIKND